MFDTEERNKALLALRIPGCLVLVLWCSLQVFHPSLPSFETFDRHTLGGDSMFNSGCIATALAYACLPWRRVESTIVWAMALVAEVYLWSQRPQDWTLQDHVTSLGFATGCIAFAGILYRCVASKGEERLWATGLVNIGIVAFAFPGLSMTLHRLVVDHAPLVYDAHAYAIDGAFGPMLAPEIGRRVFGSTWLSAVAIRVYRELGLWMMLSVLISLWAPKRTYPNLMLTYIVMGLCSYFSYLVTPMVGYNLFVGKGWEAAALPGPGTMAPWLEPDGWWRNCYPSLHMGWTLAIFWGIRRASPVVKLAFFSILVFMAPATIYPGYHYVIDLVGSFPYALSFLALAATRSPRQLRIETWCAAAALFCALTSLIRYNPLLLSDHPALEAFVVSTVVFGSIYLENRLANSVTGTEPQALAAATSGL